MEKSYLEICKIIFYFSPKLLFLLASFFFLFFSLKLANGFIFLILFAYTMCHSMTWIFSLPSFLKGFTLAFAHKERAKTKKYICRFTRIYTYRYLKNSQAKIPSSFMMTKRTRPKIISYLRRRPDTAVACISI